MAEGFVSEQRCSGRQACRYFRLQRSTYRYQAKEPDAWMVRLRSAVRRVSEEHSAWGYAKVAKLLRDEGWRVGKKLVATLRREMGLRVPKRKPKRRRRGASTGVFATVATHRGHVWTWDFIHDRTVRGGTLKMLTVVDEFTRENHLIHVDRRVRSCDVRRQLERLIGIHGAPEHIRSDNGSEWERSGHDCTQCSPQGERSESIHPPRTAGVVDGSRHQDALHRARQPVAERVHRELPL